MTAIDLYELADDVLETIAGAGCPMRENGESEWRGRCPLRDHDDLTLRVDEERERLWLGCSHVTCDWRAVHQALGITQADLRLGSGQGKTRERNLRIFDPVNMRPVRHAWEDRVPIGKPSLLVANEGTGKGVVGSWLAAGWSRGDLAGDLLGTPVNVLIVGDEDAVDDTWGPRLVAAGAVLERVFFQEISGFDIDFTEPGDIEHLRGWVKRYEIRVAILDALLDHIGGTVVDEFKPKAVRGALRPLRRLAAEEDIAVLGSLHPRKGRVFSFRDLVANSHQFNAVSRSSLLLAKDPDDPVRRLLAVGKANYAGVVPALGFRIKEAGVEHPTNGLVIKTQCAVEWIESDFDLDEVVNASTGGDRRGTFNEKKWTAIIDALTEEPQSGRAIARAAGVALSTTQKYLAELELDGIAAKTTDGMWVRGPHWVGDDAGDRPVPGENRSVGRSPGSGRHTRARARKDEQVTDRPTAFSNSSVGHPPADGQIDPDEARRARAADAIRRAQEQGRDHHD